MKQKKIIKFQNEFIEELKNKKYIFIKDYIDQEINEENIKFMNWLKIIYKNIYFLKNNNNLKKISTNNIINIPNNKELFLKMKSYLFICINPKCKSIIYLSEKEQDKFKQIQNLYLMDYDYNYQKINGYEKMRCPICLKYKCKYCNKLSTLKGTFCCISQAFKACYDSKISEYFSFFDFQFYMYTPFVRIWFFSFMFSYPLFRLLTKPNNLLQSKKEIQIKRDLGMHLKESLGLYTKKFECNCRDFELINIFHISGSILWTFPYMILFEIILTLFMIICLIFNKKHFLKFMHIFYLFQMLPIY